MLLTWIPEKDKVFREEDGEEEVYVILINPDNILFAEPSKFGTKIWMRDKHVINVEESIEELDDLIKELYSA